MTLQFVGLLIGSVAALGGGDPAPALSRLPSGPRPESTSQLFAFAARVELAGDQTSFFWPGLGAQAGLILGPAILSLAGRVAFAPDLGLPSEIDSSGDRNGLRFDSGARAELHIPLSRGLRLCPMVELGSTFLVLHHSKHGPAGIGFEHRRVFWSPRIELGAGVLLSESDGWGLELGVSVANGTNADFEIPGAQRGLVLVGRTWLGLRFGLPEESRL